MKEDAHLRLKIIVYDLQKKNLFKTIMSCSPLTPLINLLNILLQEIPLKQIR
jgi:hypothetical protein